MRIIVFLLILVSISSCAKMHIDRLNEKQKTFLLYGEDDQFSFLKNNEDTINFKVTDVYSFETSSKKETVILTFERESLTKSNYWGKIRIGSDNSYYIYYKGQTFVYNDTIYTNLNKSLTSINDLKFIGDTTLNNNKYKNVYFIYDEYDSLFFSTDKGIIQIKFNNFQDEYILLEEK